MTVGEQRKVFVVHERFTELGGSERVVEQLIASFPNAEVFVPIVSPTGRPAGLEGVTVHTSALQRFYRGHGYAHLLPLLPWAMRTADLSASDVVIASHHAFSQRVRPPDGVPLVSYVHSPARWMWEPEMRAGEPGGVAGQKALCLFAATQRRADVRAAQRPARILANSTAVADRIRRWWDRDSAVVHPPVRTDFFTPDPCLEREDFFLLAGRLVPYKRPEIAVAAATRAGVRLVVVGDGRSRKSCEAVAGPGVNFVGRVDDTAMRDLMRRARALIFPGEEDFGIIPVEAMACGTPVVALGAGGALDTVSDGVSGTLVRPPSGSQHVSAFAEALRGFDDRFDPAVVRAHAETFGERRFRKQMRAVVEEVVVSGGHDR